MTTADLLDEILGQLAQVRLRRPELRFGQLIATIGILAEGRTRRGSRCGTSKMPTLRRLWSDSPRTWHAVGRTKVNQTLRLTAAA